MATPNLEIVHITAAEDQPEVTANAAFDKLDNALNEETAKTVSGSDSLTATEQRENVLIRVGGTPSAAFTLNMANAKKRLLAFQNDTTVTCTLRNSVGAATGTVELLPGQRKLIHYDGTALRELAAGWATDSGPNVLVNPNFDLWQRGTSFTADAAYAADRWRTTFGSGGSPAYTVSRQAFTLGQTAVPNEPEFHLRFDQTAAATTTNPALEQRVEGVRSLANRQVTVDFWAKVASGTLSVTPRLTQNFGTGGAPSSAVNTDGTAVTVGTSWARHTAVVTVPSISGKTLGSNGDDYLSMTLRMPLSTTFTLDVAQVQLRRGGAALPFDVPSPADDLARAQRYYAKTFPQGTAPAQNAGLGGSRRVLADAAGDFVVQWELPIVMRAAPSVTTYNPSAANADARNTDDSTDTAVNTAATDSEVLADPSSLDATDASDRMALHLAADAEL